MRTVTWQQLEDQVRIARATGADRERRRIRDKQRDALKRLRQKAQEANRPTMFNEIFVIDAATRAKRSKRK